MSVVRENHVIETQRIYSWDGGEALKVPDVIRIKIMKDGTHQLNTLADEIIFVPPGWRHVIVRPVIYVEDT